MYVQHVVKDLQNATILLHMKNYMIPLLVQEKEFKRNSKFKTFMKIVNDVYFYCRCQTCGTFCNKKHHLEEHVKSEFSQVYADVQKNSNY